MTSTPLRRRAPLLLLALGVAVIAFPACGTAQTPEPVFDYQQLAPDVWAAVLRTKGPFAISNSLIVVSDDGVLVVDTQQSKPAVQEVIAKIREITDQPVRWIVNTHDHLDHVGGNDAYLQAFGPDVAILGHVSMQQAVDVGTRASMANEIERRTLELADRQASFERIKGNALLGADLEAQMAQGIDDLESYLEDLRHLELRPPTETFETERVLHLGEREVDLIHPGPAHTQGDVAVWLPSDGILAVGDLLEDGLSIVRDASTPTGWAVALDSLSKLDVKTLLPSHGAVQDRKLLDRQRDLFGAVVREARKARQNGLTMDQAWDQIVDAADAALRPDGGSLPVPLAMFMDWLERCIPRAWDEARQETSRNGGVTAR